MQLKKFLLAVPVFNLILMFLHVSATIELYDTYNIHSNPAAFLELIMFLLNLIAIPICIYVYKKDTKKIDRQS